MSRPQRIQKNSRTAAKLTLSKRILLITAVAVLALGGLAITGSSALKNFDRSAVNAGAPDERSSGQPSATTNSGGVNLAETTSQPANDGSGQLTGLNRLLAPPNGFFNPAVPMITASKTDALLVDNDSDTKADPGDTLRYTVTIGVSGMDANGVMFNDTPDANTMVVPGSLRTTPLARPDSYTASGNIRITKNSASGVLANDQDFDGVGPALTVTAGTFLSANNGNVTLNADGSFTYNPPPGFEGDDTFTYTLNDNDSPSNQTDTGTVTVTVSDMIWFVNTAATCPCDGRLTNPFKNLTGADSFDAGAADDPGDNIFVYSGSYTGGLTLLNMQTIIGQGAGDSLSNITGIFPPMGSDSLPATGGARPTVSSSGTTITLGQNNLLRGFNITNSGTGGSGISGTMFGTLNALEIAVNGTGRALNLNNGTLATTFDSITSTNSTTNGINLSNTSGTFSITGATLVTNATGAGINIASASGTLTFAGTTINSRNATGISITSSSGTFTFGSTSIPNPNAAGGYGIEIQNSSAAFTFASATISDANLVTAQNDADNDGIPNTNGDGDGIFLNNNTGSFTLNGGSITNSGNDGIDLRSSSTLVLSNVSISNPGQDVTGATGAGFGGHAISAINLTGTSSITGGTISGFNVANRDGLYLVNTTSTALNLTIHGATFQNAIGNRGVGIQGRSAANMTVTVGGPTNNVATNCIFSNILGTALQSTAGASTGSTATVNLTVQNSTFQSSPTDGKTNLIAGVVEAGKSTLVIQDNTFNNVFITASTGEALININNDGTLAGNQLGLTLQRNNINNVGSAANNCGGGAVPCRGPLNTVLIFMDDAANVPTTLIVDNNTLTNVQQGGIFLDMANTGVPASAVNAKIINNCIGRLRVGAACTGALAPVGAGAGITIASGIRVERRRNNSPNGNVLISGNVIRNGAGGAGSTLNSPGIFARTKANSNLSVTVTNNDVDTNLTGGVAEMRFDTNANEVGDIVAPVECDDVTGNTLPAGAAAIIDFNEINGTHNVEQASAAAVSAANSGATVTADAGVAFGVACAAPPAARTEADASNQNAKSKQNNTLAIAPLTTSQPEQRSGAAAPTTSGTLRVRSQARTPDTVGMPNNGGLETNRSGFRNAQSRIENHALGLQAKARRKGGAVFHHPVASASGPLASAVAPSTPSSSGSVMVNIGNLPAGKSVTITFDVTINDPLTGTPTEVCNQGTVTADGPISVMTDDPDVGGTADPTCTMLDQPDVTVAVSPASVQEDGATNLVYTFTREGSTAGPLTVNFTVAGTASSSTDYTVTGAATFDGVNGTVTIPMGSSTAAITVDPTVDTTVEPDETVIVSVATGSGYDVGTPGSDTGTIINDDTDVSVAVSPSAVDEDGATNLVYTFTRVGVTTGALTVNFSVGGTATFSTDYTQIGAATFDGMTGTVMFGAGNSTAMVTVDPTTDSTVEPDETVILTVTAGTGYNVAAMNSSATGTITNDDTDVSVAVAPSSVDEDGATNLVYTFTRVGVTSSALTVNFTIGGTATFSTDYSQMGAASFVPPNGTVMFGAGNSTATVTVDPTADMTAEPDETVILTLASGTGYNVVEPSSATGTITNDDTIVTVAVSPGAVDEDGATNLVYTFTRSDSSGTLTVNFSVGGTATFSTDYTQTGADTFNASSGTVSFADGSMTTMVTVDPSADTMVEPDETVVLTVVAGMGYGVGSPDTATGTITNDDTDVSVAVSPSAVDEDGATNLVYTFTRVGVTTGALTVNFSVGGTATFNTDYTQTGAASFTPPTGTVMFGAGNSTAIVTVDPTADSTVEPDETVILTVTSGMGYTVGSPDSATGTITNDDTDVSVAVAPSSVDEDGATNLVYTFTRVGVTSSALTVNFTIGGTATFSTDYSQMGAASFVPPNGTVMFGAGNSTATVTVDPTADMTAEPDETVILTLASGTGYNVVEPSSATGTIINDDTVVTVAVSPGAVDEDGATNLVYTFTRNDSSGALTVNFNVSGTATFNTDYTQMGADTFSASSGTVSFADGSLTTTVTVDPTADLTVEPDETVTLMVAPGMGYGVGMPDTATGTITNDDTDVSVAVSPSAVNEDGATNLVYTFTRVGVTTGALTVNFSIGGTATFSSDYSQMGAATFVPPNGTVMFGAGNSTAMVTVDPTTDSTVEPDETVILTVAPGAGYNVAAMNSSATGTITNDDTDVSVAVAPSSVLEDGATNLVYTFTRVGVTSSALTVNFTIGGTATFSTDYSQMGAASFVPPNGTVMFGAGNSTANVTIDPTADMIAEPDETVILTVAAGTGYNVASPSSATGTILNDDAVDVEITAKTDTPDPVCVGQKITYTINFRNNGPGPATNAKVSDAIPANTTFVSATLPMGWSRADSVMAGGTGTLMFTKASVANGETATFKVVVKVSSGTAGGTIISNTATASSDFPDTTPGNNSKTAMTTVDPTPPMISGLSANPATLWPPNHKMRDVTINYTPTDNCPGTVNCSITNITSNEPINGTGDGDTSPDWQFVNNHRVRLRAERAGGGNGRIYTITVTCTDAAGNTTTRTVEVRVPHNMSSRAGGSGFKANSPVTFSGTFRDQTGRMHTAQWQFDNLATSGTPTQPRGSKNDSVKTPETFNEPGIYKVTLKVTDNNGMMSWVDTQDDPQAIVVIHDPGGRYNLGDGWFASPPGAYAYDPSATGRLSFSFDSKYKNAEHLKGESQITFKLGDLDFSPLNYDYLVISEARAELHGFGKINGSTGYDFILTVIDGSLAGGDGVDRFRIKIWNQTTGAIIYDSQMG